MKFKKGDRIEVYWRDHTSLHGWRSEAEIDKNAFCSPCKSVGYFYKKTQRDFILSRTLEIESKEQLETEVIPKKMIDKVRKLR